MFSNRVAVAQDTIETEVGTHWFESENFGIRFLSERDFPIDDDSSDAVSDEDWAAFAEMSWVDPMERDF